MRPPAFDYVVPYDIHEAVALVSQTPGAVVLAGGQSLIPMLNRREVRPPLVVDLNHITALQQVTDSNNEFRIGATIRHRALELNADIARHAPSIAMAARLIGDPSIRRRGTIGGSLAHAQPAAQLPVACALADALIDATGPHGGRTLPAAAFFRGPGLTVLEPGEVITAIRVPFKTAHEGFAVNTFRDVGQRAGITAAARVQLDGQGNCIQARVVVGLEQPAVTIPLTEILQGQQRLTEALLRTAVDQSITWLSVAEDASATAELRLYQSVIATAIARAWLNSEENSR